MVRTNSSPNGIIPHAYSVYLPLSSSGDGTMHNTELNEAPPHSELDELIRTTEDFLQRLKAAKKQGASNIPTEQHGEEPRPEVAPQGSFKTILKSII